jgi:hypothetical protein
VLDKKKEYSNLLLSTIKRLEQNVESSINEDVFSFSFFKESFDQTEKIMRLLHELENMQVDEMKTQMEKLVKFLSETENRMQDKSFDRQQKKYNEEEKSGEKEPKVDNRPTQIVMPELSSDSTDRHNQYAENIVFPQYMKPETPKVNVDPVAASPKNIESTKETSDVSIKSFNETIGKEPAVVDLKKAISLNDRFLFQRELFGNNREAMNDMITRLNSFGNFNEAEKYLKENTSWDFDDSVVQDFLFVIKKGFE